MEKHDPFDPNERIVVGDCYSTSWCPKCDRRLRDGVFDSEVTGRGGVCPGCGHKGGATVCDYETRVYRRVRRQFRRPWLFFFSRWVTVEDDIEFVSSGRKGR